MSRVVWFNCSAGVAGDMLLAALIDAGADRLAVMHAWGALGVDGFAATWERVQRCGVASLWTNLAIDGPAHHHDAHDHDAHDHDAHDHDAHDHDGHDGHDHGHADQHDHVHRPASEVLALIDDADLDERVRAMATAVYASLAEVEGEIHGMNPADVELHEVGALDSILDVVGVCAALADLGIDRLLYSPIAVGHGTVETQHGTLPNPVPAVSRLLARAGAATHGVDTTMELSTPTGVALVTVLGDGCGPMPSMRVRANGFGAGTVDPPGRPNVVQAVLGDADDAAAADGGGRTCLQFEANVDDATPEVLAHAVASILAAGAHDAWITPIIMKKGRPAHTVHALCDDAAIDAVRATIVDETGTFGLRAFRVERWPQRRRDAAVVVDGHEIRVKIGGHRVKVEHDDAAAAAAALGRPLRDVMDAASRAADDLAAD